MPCTHTTSSLYMQIWLAGELKVHTCMKFIWASILPVCMCCMCICDMFILLFYLEYLSILSSIYFVLVYMFCVHVCLCLSCCIMSIHSYMHPYKRCIQAFTVHIHWCPAYKAVWETFDPRLPLYWLKKLNFTALLA